MRIIIKSNMSLIASSSGLDCQALWFRLRVENMVVRGSSSLRADEGVQEFGSGFTISSGHQVRLVFLKIVLWSLKSFHFHVCTSLCVCFDILLR